MRILSLEQFCKEPEGTLFSCYDGGSNDGDLMVKTGYFEWEGKPTFNGIVRLTPDFETQEYEDFYSGSPSEIRKYYTECFSTDTAECDFDKAQLFAVYSKEEIRRMIDVLTYALCDGKCRLNSYDDNAIYC